MNPAKFLEKQFSEALQKQPGWIYLGLTVYLAVHLLKLPWLSREIWVAVLTPLFYWIGDGIDSAWFRLPDKQERFRLRELNEQRKIARDHLRIQGGVYQVAMSFLAESGEPRHRAAVRFQNEFAKFLRSLACPVVLLGIYVGVASHPGYWALLILAVPLVLASFGLKLLHLRTLYSLVPYLCRPGGYTAYDLPQNTAGAASIRLFFWEGKLVASALLEPDERKRTREALLLESQPASLQAESFSLVADHGSSDTSTLTRRSSEASNDQSRP